MKTAKALELLRKAAKQFRYYEQQHVAKADVIATRIREERLGQQARDEIDKAMVKAQVNGEFAAEIEDFLASHDAPNDPNSVQGVDHWAGH